MYRIRDWNIYYETSETRKWKTLKWVPLRVKLDGRNYRRLMKSKQGPKVFGCWCALLEAASRCDPRGDFMDSCGNVYTVEDLALVTAMPQALIKETLTTLSKHPFDWIETVGADQSPALAEESPARIEQDSIEQDRTRSQTEQDRTEPLPPIFHSKYFSITAEQHEQYVKTYDRIDVAKSYEEMVAWLISNPKRARKKSWSRFVNNWLKTNNEEAEPFAVEDARIKAEYARERQPATAPRTPTETPEQIETRERLERERVEKNLAEMRQRVVDGTGSKMDIDLVAVMDRVEADGTAIGD